MTLSGVYVGNDDQAFTDYTTYMGGTAPQLVYASLGMAHWSNAIADVNFVKNLWANRPAETDIFWSVPLTVWEDATTTWNDATKQWNPPTNSDGAATLAEAANHEFDGYYYQMAQAILLAQPGETTIHIRTGWEFNYSPLTPEGDMKEGGFPWKVTTAEDAANFKLAFINFVQAFKQAAIDAQRGDVFKFEWNVMEGWADSRLPNPEDAFPGAEYVDVIGMDFYWKQNHGSDAAAAFAAMSEAKMRDDDPTQWAHYNLAWNKYMGEKYGVPVGFSEWGVPQDRPLTQDQIEKGQIRVADASAYIEGVLDWFQSANNGAGAEYQIYWNSDDDYQGAMDMVGPLDVTSQAYKNAFDDIPDTEVPPVEGPPVSGEPTNPVMGNSSLAGEHLVGTSGNDMLDGLGGGDTLEGGAGDDTYQVRNAADVALEAANGGIDTVRAGMSWTLGANIENLVLTGTEAASGTGNDLANRLDGNEASNTLDGMGGNDWLTGGDGDDTFVIRKGEGNDTVTDFHPGAASGELIRLDGFSFTDGAAVLAAATQQGEDVVIALGDGQTLTLKGIQLSALTASDFDLVNIPPPGGVPGSDLAPLSGEGEVWRDGTAAAETVNGTANNDVINGQGGGDTLVGGAGDDHYYLNPGDTVVEAANGGIDTVYTWEDGRFLAANVENLVLTGTGWTSGTGNGLNNRIDGNDAPNLIDGKGGNDVLTGNGGSDTFVIARGQGNDLITDFQAGAGGDVIRLDGFSFANFAAVKAAATQVGSNVSIALGNGQTLTLLGQTVGALTSENVVISPAVEHITYAVPTSAAATPTSNATVNVWIGME